MAFILSLKTIRARKLQDCGASCTLKYLDDNVQGEVVYKVVSSALTHCAKEFDDKHLPNIPDEDYNKIVDEILRRVDITASKGTFCCYVYVRNEKTSDVYSTRTF